MQYSTGTRVVLVSVRLALAGRVRVVCGLFLVLYGMRTSNPVGCYECAGERYVDMVGVTVRKYAYEYE